MPDRTCSVCLKPEVPRQFKRGMCGACYQRAQRYGFVTPPPLYGMDLFWSKVDKGAPGGCWRWLGQTEKGYGLFGDRRYFGTRLAHRIAYTDIHGEISEGMTLDHLCHTHDESCAGGVSCQHRACVNPDHLEPVPSVVNILRGRGPGATNAQKTSCGKCGGPFDVLRVGGKRGCRRCMKAYGAAHYQASKSA